MSGSVSQGQADADRQTQVMAVVVRLRQVLEQEFDALKNQELDRFESLQPAKNALLAELSACAPEASLLQNDVQWHEVHAALVECRDMHRRNAVLIERKLDAIRNALQSLSLASQTSSVEVYDRLGQVARFQRGRGYQDA